MSLPTPPSTSHRDKENRIPLSKFHVIWSPDNQYHPINDIPQVPTANSASKTFPAKSILKRRPEALPLVAAFQREVTPEPPQPQDDSNYLSSPVVDIIKPSASLDELIRAYSVLAARIRANTAQSSEVDASWPIFDPLRKHSIAFEAAVIRDLGRCLVDPETMEQSADDVEEILPPMEEPVLLPSPKSSPKKKKKGTTAKKAKYGRDLCTTSHSVIKLLGVVFTLPAVSRIFTVPQLRSILTQVLAIPLADDLPTPYARKTYALSIWLLQSQRLPAEVLEPAADRIVFALRRGIEGELGKEGKKGSASDGLKAIHDLCVYQPSMFIPKFEALLPSLLANLLASTVTIRAQACHALGGLARGLASLPLSSLHTRISATTVGVLTAIPSPSKRSPTKTGLNEAQIVRTLRTTLNATEAPHVSQGPVWGLCVLASLLVLANSAVYANKKARSVFTALLSLSMRHTKSTIRSLGCAVWRSVAWVYFQPLLPTDSDNESEVDEDDTASRRAIEESRDVFWKCVVATVVDMGAGTSIVAGLLKEAGGSEESLDRVETVLKVMLSKGGINPKAAINVLERIISFEPFDEEWSWNKLLPRNLFSASPGLLTVDFSSLETPVRSIITQCPDLFDVRSLTREDVAQVSIFHKLLEIWKECLGSLGLRDDDEIPSKILSIWENMLQAFAGGLQTENDTSEFAAHVAEILVDILHDGNIDVTSKTVEVRFCSEGHLPANLSNAALKLKLARRLWAITRKIIPSARLSVAGDKLVYCLITGEDEFTDSGDVSRTEWAIFCAEVLIICDPEDLQDFWAYDGAPNSKWEWTDAIRSTVWTCFVEKWREESECAWEAVLTLLAVPFTARSVWEFTDSNYELWESFLGFGIDKATDYGLDTVVVLDHVAANIVKERNPTSTTASRVADVLLSHLTMDDIREIPETFFEFINDTLRSSYPPEPRNKQRALWTIRSLVRTIESCPAEHIMQLLQLIEEGLCIWVSDEHKALDDSEYLYDSVSLYEMTLLRIRALPRTVETLENLGSILESAFVGREDKPAAMTDAFAEFWDSTYAEVPVPSGGWPAEIHACLGISSEEEVDQLDHNSPWGKVVLSPAFRGERVITSSGKEVPIGSPFTLRTAVFRSVSPEAQDGSDRAGPHAVAPVVQPPRPVTPTTPVTVRSRASTPPRPHKYPFGTQVFDLTSPDSPLSAPYPPSTPSTPPRTPRSVSGSKPSPSKRRKLDNKENESPRMAITSVLDRIMASPGSTNEVARSKKHAPPDRGEEDRPLKRSKMDVALRGDDSAALRPAAADNDDAEEERSVAFSLVERPSGAKPVVIDLTADEPQTPPVSCSKKRKRVLFDAVEVPSVREVYGRVKVPVSPDDAFEFAFSTPANSNRMRTRSTAVPRRASGDAQALSRKRRRDSNEASEDPFTVVRGLGSDDSMDARSSSDASSDDDQYFGQVTPFHVFSPALRRARDDDPPSSDDSMSASPLKGVVSRRLQKTASNGRIPVSLTSQ